MPCFPVLRGSGAEGERWRRAAEAVGSIAISMCDYLSVVITILF